MKKHTDIYDFILDHPEYNEKPYFASIDYSDDVINAFNSNRQDQSFYWSLYNPNEKSSAVGYITDDMYFTIDTSDEPDIVNKDLFCRINFYNIPRNIKRKIVYYLYSRE